MEKNKSYFDPHKQIHSKNNRRFSRYYYKLAKFWNSKIAHRKIVIINAFVSISWGKIEHNNWGDDINLLFLRHITKDYLLPLRSIAYPSSDIYYVNCDDLPTIVSAIGSTIQMIDRPNAVIWGSGLIQDNITPNLTAAKICAVRGPLTREILIRNGIQCPEVYGDPALLLPLYYTPKHLKKKKKYKIGIIPHYVDFFKEELQQFSKISNILIIKTFRYNKWTDFIDQVNSCEFIVSSSLHGLIIAEAYNIPNLWAEFQEPIIGDTHRRFKFHDFFQSIQLDRELPYTINIGTSFSDLYEQRNYYKKAPGLSLMPLINSCPFSLKLSSLNIEEKTT